MDYSAAVALALVAAALASGCLSSGKAQNSNDITPERANELIDSNMDNPGFIVLDVRTPDEYASGHIGGAVNVDYYAKDFKDRLAGLDRSKTYLVYCRTGHRSGDSVRIMGGMGFNSTYSMLGGITSWNDRGYQTVSG